MKISKELAIIDKIKCKNYVNKKQIKIKPYNSIQIQNHADIGVWEVITGEGILYSDEKESILCSGDIIEFEVFESHSVKNNNNQDFIFNAYWYIDENLLKNFQLKKNKNSTIIGTAFPTPNGALHLGHIAGPYLSAYILSKYKELNNDIVVSYCGTDATVSHISRTAEKLKTNYDLLLCDSEKQITKGFDGLELKYDHFLFTKNHEQLNELALELLQKLRKSGFLFEKEVLQPFDPDDQQFVIGSNLSGKCPNCKKITIAIECENCGYFQDEALIIDSYHSDFPHKKLTQRKLKKLYLKIDHDILEAIIINLHQENSVHSHYIIDLLYNYKVNSLFNEFPISIIADKTVTIKDMTAPFIRSLRHYYIIKKFPHYHNYTFFCGIDNVCAHALLASYILTIIGAPKNLVPNFILNKFYSLEGEKFSSSRNHAIWFNDIAKLHHIDLLRFYLAKTSPVYSETNFYMNEFKSEIKAIRYKLLTILEKINKNCKNISGNQIEAGQWSDNDIEFYQTINSIYSKCLLNCEILNIPAYVLNFENFIGHLDLYLDLNINLPVKHLFRTNLYLQLYALKLLSIIIYPTMSNFAKKLSNALGIEKINENNDLAIFEKVNLGNAITFVKENY